MHQTPFQGDRGDQGWNQTTYSRKTAPTQTLHHIGGKNSIRELKEDHFWVVLTAGNWVAMVVLNREDYKDKAQLLLADTNACKAIMKDPTNKLKNKFSQTLRVIKKPPKFYGLPKIHKLASPSGPLSPVGGPSHLEWLRSWVTSCTPWLASLQTILKTLTTSYNTLRR